MRVKIEKLDNFGRGIAYIDNKICFIENALEGEIVAINITKKAKKYLEAEVINYEEKSKTREEEECPYSKYCGGCHLNHMSFEEENIFKRKKVIDLMKKFAKLDSNKIKEISHHERNHYRNKITLHGNKQQLGLYKRNSNEIIPIEKCLLVNKKINEIIKILNQSKNEINEAIIKTSNDKKEVMVCIKGSIEKKESLLNICNVLKINDKYMTTKKDILTMIGDKKYHEGIDSFFQVNTSLTKDLYDEVVNIIKTEKYNTALDLYCGTGTIGIYISDFCKEVIGIDYNRSNIEDANKNKDENHIPNIEFICDKVENKIEKFQNIDLVIVDPPRAGLDSKTKNHLLKIHPKKIVYISCDPVTLARDLNELKEIYEVKQIKPFNMFPRTYHVESVSVLERKSVEK